MEGGGDGGPCWQKLFPLSSALLTVNGGGLGSAGAAPAFLDPACPQEKGLYPPPTNTHLDEASNLRGCHRGGDAVLVHHQRGYGLG
jgi:hypothetical protein